MQAIQGKDTKITCSIWKNVRWGRKYDKLSEEVPDVHMKHMASNPSFYYYSLLIIGRWNLNSLVCDFVSHCLEPWVSVIWGERQFSLVGLEWGCLIQWSLPINQRWRQLEEMQWLDDRTRKRGIVSSSLFSEDFDENTVPLERFNLWFVLYLKQDTLSWWSYPKDQRACFWQIPRGIIWVTVLKDVLLLVTNTLSLPS